VAGGNDVASSRHGGAVGLILLREKLSHGQTLAPIQFFILRRRLRVLARH
jgi:hypothetical protein